MTYVSFVEILAKAVESFQDSKGTQGGVGNRWTLLFGNLKSPIFAESKIGQNTWELKSCNAATKIDFLELSILKKNTLLS